MEEFKCHVFVNSSEQRCSGNRTEGKKENLISRLDVDLLREVVDFLNVFASLFDMLEFANIPTLQNTLPVYYTLYEQ